MVASGNGSGSGDDTKHWGWGMAMATGIRAGYGDGASWWGWVWCWHQALGLGYGDDTRRRNWGMVMVSDITTGVVAALLPSPFLCDGQPSPCPHHWALTLLLPLACSHGGGADRPVLPAGVGSCGGWWVRCFCAQQPAGAIPSLGREGGIFHPSVCSHYILCLLISSGHPREGGRPL